MDMVIIAGFLGSGKTTLILNTVGKITEDTGKKIAIIVNDFGNIGIDGKVMERYGLKVQELPKGCICCTLGPNFLETLRVIHDKFSPDLLVVEPSGIADPDSILATMEHYRGPPLGFVKVALLIDAVRFPIISQAMAIPLKKHLQVADIVLITKVDDVDASRIESIESYVRDVAGERMIIPVSSINGSNLDVVSKALVSK